MCKMIILLDYEVSEFDDASRASDTTTVASVTSTGDSEQNSRSVVDAPAGPFDVLFGRGKPFINHHGNDRMRRIVEAYKARYEAAEKQEKTLITQEVVHIIKNSGEQKGRFLKQQGKGKDAPWFEVSTKEAHKKVAHRLREDKAKYSISPLIIAKREQVTQPNLKSIANLKDPSPLHTRPQFDEKTRGGLSYLEAITVQSVPLEEQPGWSISPSSIASTASLPGAGILYIDSDEVESRKTEQLSLPLSANFPRYQSGVDEDHEEEDTTDTSCESLEGDEQDPLDLSLADTSQLSNKQANYLLDRLEHLEIKGGDLPVIAAAVFESSAGHPSDENVQVTAQQPIPESLEGHLFSYVAETMDDELLDDFYSLVGDDDDFFVNEVDEVVQQMSDNEKQQSSDQSPLLEPTKEPAKLVPSNDTESIQDTQ
jgi:hypothetical protein